MGYNSMPAPPPQLPGRAEHVSRFEVLSELEDVWNDSQLRTAILHVTGGHINMRTVVVETKVDAQRLPVVWSDAQSVGRVLYMSPWLPHKNELAIEVYAACERVVEAMNHMNLALQANDAQDVFNHLWSMEQIDVTDTSKT
jgi:hypothetical protein